MGEALIEGSNWRLVEVGRVVVIKGADHPADGRIAAIVEIVDHKRVRSRRLLERCANDTNPSSGPR